MKIEITPSALHGEVVAPASKSLSHRAIIAASLGLGTSTLTGVLKADDIQQTIQGLQLLGVRISTAGTTLSIMGSGGKLHAPMAPIHVGQSGSSLRFLAAVSGLAHGGATTLTGDDRLCQRPMKDMVRPLGKMGVTLQSIKNNDCAPVTITGGKISGGEITIEGSMSSQFISALLLIAPFAQNKTTIRCLNVRSKPYIELTVRVMRDFGIEVIKSDDDTFVIAPMQQYKAKTYAIEGDYSSSSYFFAAAAITKSSITVKNLNPASVQGDRHFLSLLEQMGCNVSPDGGGITILPAKTLQAITVDLGDYPDIVQSIAVVAAFAHGITKIINIGHLKHKETDRLKAVATELGKMGINVAQDEDSLTIVGGNLKGTQIDTHDDHRMAMSFAVAGLGATGTTVIQDADVVNKSFPEFFHELRALGAHTKEII